MAQQTQKRKAEHIRICLEQKAQAKCATAGFEDVQLIHRALPEVNKREINLETKFIGKKIKAPIIVGAMTGGTEQATQINANIAQAVEKLGLGMGVGSQRAAIENKTLESTYAVARKNAPTAFLIANLGGVQLIHGYGVKEVKKTVEMIGADAVAVHLNALQEALQAEGQTNFKGVLSEIGKLAGMLDVPVIVKETGAGICGEDAKLLADAGVKAIDVGGVGGTSFAAVEYYRSTEREGRDEAFWDWGIPTVTSLVEVTQSVKLPVIASGGVRSGIDAAKALALNASLASIAQPALEPATKSSVEVEDYLSSLLEQLRDAMFLVGSKDLEQLAYTPLVIGGKTAEWLKTRGFNIEKYARPGAR